MKGSQLFNIFKAAEIAKNIKNTSVQSLSAVNILITKDK